MLVLTHPLKGLNRETGFLVPSIRLLIHFLSVLQQWKISLPAHHSDLFEAEFTITQATVVFLSLCEIYLKRKFNHPLPNTVSRSKSVSSTTTTVDNFSTFILTSSPYLEQNEPSTLENEFSPYPTFISVASHDLIQSLLSSLSANESSRPLNSISAEDTNLSPEDTSLRTSDKTSLKHDNPSSPIIRSHPLSTLTSQSFRPTSTTSPASLTASSSFSPVAPSTPSSYSSLFSQIQNSPKLVYSASSRFDNASLAHTDSETLIKTNIDKIRQLAMCLESDFFCAQASSTSSASFPPLKFHPSLKSLLEPLDEKAKEAMNFSTFIPYLKSELSRKKFTSSVLLNYLSFFTSYPSAYPSAPFSSLTTNKNQLPDYVLNLPSHHTDLIDFWWHQNRFGVEERFSVVASKLSEYLQAVDPLASSLWDHFNSSSVLNSVKTKALGSETLWYPEDLTLSLNQSVYITDLARIFPCDTVYSTTIGDWIFWRLFG
ncbi:hypothetical protein HMI55_001721, partial [Coelomomyces lativittatus]